MAKGPNRQMDMGMSLIGVEGEDIGMAVAERLAGEGPRRIVHAERVRARRHAEHDGQADRAILAATWIRLDLRHPISDEPPDLGPGLKPLAVRPLKRKFSVPPDIGEMVLEMTAVAGPPRDLDHHFWHASGDPIEPGMGAHVGAGACDLPGGSVRRARLCRTGGRTASSNPRTWTKSAISGPTNSGGCP